MMGMIKKIRNLPLKERIKLYNEVMYLHKKYRWGYVKIGRSLSIPIDVVRHWLHHGRDPRRHGRMHMFKGDPSPELAYIIGVCQGDADLPKAGKSRERAGQKIRLRAIDKDFVKTFATRAEKVLGKKEPYTIGIEGKSYRVLVNSYYLHNFLKRPFEDMKPFIEECPAEFIKGMVDSEGSAKVSAVTWKERKIMSLVISVTNSDIKLLEYIRDLLKRYFYIGSKIKSSYKAGSKFIINNKTRIRRKNSYELIIGKFNDVKSFSDTMGFSIGKKQRKMLDAINIIDEHKSGDERVLAWQKLYHKEKNKWVRKHL